MMVFCVIRLSAQTTLPHFFSDNMVLQQNDTVSIWGMDKSKTNISLKTSWGAEGKTKTAKNGKWIIKLVTPVAVVQCLTCNYQQD